MNPKPLTRRPRFITFSVAFILLALYVFLLWRTRSARSTQLFLVDLLIFVFAFGSMLAITSQFVLPVQSWGDRWRALQRLASRIEGPHGPVMFIKDGEPVEGKRERSRRAPGVILVDSVSAAVFKSDTRFTRSVGPGIYFTFGGETLAESVDLRPQVRLLKGSTPEPGQTVDPDKTSSMAMTKDGISLSADLSVSFVLERGNVNYDRPPYVFGPVARRSTALAVYGHAYKEDDDVPWSEIPIRLVADLWREKVKEWPLDALVRGVDRDLLLTLFNAPIGDRPQYLAAWEERIQDWPVDPLVEIFAGDPYVDGGVWTWIENLPEEGRSSEADEAQLNYSPLRLIQQQINARLSPPPPEAEASVEYVVLSDRGIRVTRAGVSNLQLPRAVRDEYFERWRQKWAGQAKAKRDQAAQDLHNAGREGQIEALTLLAPSLLASLEANLQADLLLNRRETFSLILSGATALAEEQISPDDGGVLQTKLEAILGELPGQDADCWNIAPGGGL